ncbi:MAG: AI-2E family transporter [Candidatus Dadabacteria bacterium]|nr:MAG: AI-2E family transporter [Candidatus Dadabacteria bacterium]
MFDYLRDWYERAFSDPRAVTLTVILLLAAGLIWLAVELVPPLLVSLVLAYLLEGLVGRLERIGLGRKAAVWIVYALFLLFALLLLTVALPLVIVEAGDFLRQLPTFMAQWRADLAELAARYPTLLSAEQIQLLLADVGREAGRLGQQLVSISIAWLPGLMASFVYLILVPLMIWFLLADRYEIQAWAKRFLPSERSLAREVWNEVDAQLANYVRGKFVEITIVGSVTYVALALLHLQYAALLGLAVGMSVLIPYVGATVVTIPVALIAAFQYGLTSDFATVVIAYLVIQGLDGNVLVPFLFSEMVNLHPLAIIVAVLLFGGLWGVWGVFFAIPLAIVIRAVLEAWPKAEPQAAAD